MSESIIEQIVDDFLDQIEHEGVIALPDLQRLKGILLSDEKPKNDDIVNFIAETIG